MKSICSIRQLCLNQCFNIFACSSSHMVHYISSWKNPPCILLSSILRDSLLCRVKCRGFTERLCPPGPVPQQLWLIKRILSTTGKKKNLFSARSQPTTPVLSLRRKRPTSKCQLSQELLPLFPLWKMSDGGWFSALWFHRSGDRTVRGRYSVPVW